MISFMDLELISGLMVPTTLDSGKMETCMARVIIPYLMEEGIQAGLSMTRKKDSELYISLTDQSTREISKKESSMDKEDS